MRKGKRCIFRQNLLCLLGCIPCLRAAGDVRFCLIGAMTGMWLGRILCSHLFVSFGWGIMGVWVAIVADWFIRIAFYLPRYLSGRWLKKKVI